MSKIIAFLLPKFIVQTINFNGFCGVSLEVDIDGDL